MLLKYKKRGCAHIVYHSLQEELCKFIAEFLTKAHRSITVIYYGLDFLDLVRGGKKKSHLHLSALLRGESLFLGVLKFVSVQEGWDLESVVIAGFVQFTGEGR